VFRIKICGITSRRDAQAAAEVGAEAIGLNFFRPSPRCVSETAAAEIAEAIRGRVEIVGVFVNHSAEQIRRVAESLELDYVQLHGDEPFEMLEELAGLRLLRAFRCKTGGLEPVVEFVDRARDQGVNLSAVLIDAHEPGSYGGTGRTVDWDSVRRAKDGLSGVPVVLAGGLTPDNVASAIAAARPSAVDTASGVELSPGVKSRDLMSEFVAAAKNGFLR